MRIDDAVPSESCSASTWKHSLFSLSHLPAPHPHSQSVRRRWPAPLVALTLLAAVALAPTPAVAEGFHPAIDERVFPVPVSLRPAIAFWKDIFAEYDTHHVVIHDDRHLQLIYEVVDVSDLVLSGRSEVAQARERRRRVKAAMDRTRSALRSLSGDRRARAVHDDIVRIKELTRAYGGERTWYRAAAERVRSQRGLRETFGSAIQISGMFMDEIERTLEKEGLPLEISRLPFIESMFNYKARSKVGASGAWQFTRSTGRLYLRIDSAVDERSDVLLAARGAAKYLQSNYRRVESWPLALTGYNHGVGGMVRAMKRLGTKDMGVIAERYRSRTFGFASRNFYAEFVAAVMVYHDREKYFPGIEPLPSLEFEEFVPDRYVSLLDLAALAELPEDELVQLNPSLSRSVVAGDLLVPSGFALKVPKDRLTETLNAYELIPSDRKRTRQLAQRHRVRRGETVGRIARRYGTTVRRIQTANNLPRADRIYVGQVLEIPTSGRGSDWSRRLSAAQIEAIRNPPTVTEAEVALADNHVVQPGESLSVIAERYRVSVGSLVRLNGLRSPDRLQVGQRLRISADATNGHQGDDESKRTYTVRRGDTLHHIAAAFDTTVRALMRVNSLDSSFLSIGQVLVLP